MLSWAEGTEKEFAASCKVRTLGGSVMAVVLVFEASIAHLQLSLSLSLSLSLTEILGCLQLGAMGQTLE